MSKNDAIELAILDAYISEMEELGVTRNDLGMNPALLLVALNKTRKKKNNYPFEKIEKAFKRCISKGWVEPLYLTVSQANRWKVTEKGLGVARSKRVQDSRSALRKLSDIFEAHNGIFTFLSFLLSMSAIIISVFGALPSE